MATTTYQKIDIIQTREHSWWLPLVQGIALIALGVILFGEPLHTLNALSNAMGIYFLISGVTGLVGVLLNRTERSLVWVTLSSIISLTAGVVVLSAPVRAGLVTTTLLIYFLAVAAMISGVLLMAFGRRVDDLCDREWSWGSFILGLLYLAFGLILISSPIMAAGTTMLLLMPVFAITGGMLLVFMAFRIRRR